MRLLAPQGPDPAQAGGTARPGGDLLSDPCLADGVEIRLKGVRMRYRVQAEPDARAYSDLAIAPVIDAEEEALEMFSLNDSARLAVKKARSQAQRRK